MNPMRGAKTTPFGRMLPAAYNDGKFATDLKVLILILKIFTGLYELRRSVSNEELPSARRIANVALQSAALSVYRAATTNSLSYRFAIWLGQDVGIVLSASPRGKFWSDRNFIFVHSPCYHHRS